MGDESKSSSASGGFLRLWILLVLTYTGIKLAFDQLVMGYFDARPRSMAGLILIPTAQAMIFWLVSRRARQAPSDSSGAKSR